MTCIDSHCVQTDAGRPAAASASRKAVLFCPGCGFESDANENWIVRSADLGEEFVCPNCEKAVATR